MSPILAIPGDDNSSRRQSGIPAKPRHVAGKSDRRSSRQAEAAQSKLLHFFTVKESMKVSNV